MCRLLFFCMGVLFVALGVAISTKAAPGTSPISAIPYSLSLYFNFLSFGQWVILFNLSLILIEWILLKKDITIGNILIQIFLTFGFGYCIDIFMYLLSNFNPGAYPLQIFTVLAGCMIIAIGVCLSLWSHVSMLPGDGFILAVSTLVKMDFGRIRMISDILMSISGVAICLIMARDFSGVREGTAIAAVATGLFVTLIIKTSARFCGKS